MSDVNTGDDTLDVLVLFALPLTVNITFWYIAADNCDTVATTPAAPDDDGPNINVNPLLDPGIVSTSDGSDDPFPACVTGTLATVIELRNVSVTNDKYFNTVDTFGDPPVFDANKLL